MGKDVSRSAASAVLVLLAITLSCGSQEATGPVLPPDAVVLTPGLAAAVVNGQQIEVVGGASGGEFVLVVTDTATAGTGMSTFQLATNGIGVPGSVSPPSTSRLPSASSFPASSAAGARRLDIGFGSRLNERYRRRFVPLFASARGSISASRSSRARSDVQTGDVLTYNVSPSACDSIMNHGARVVAVGSQAIIVEDTLNPAGGFSSAEYQRFAANFDTLIYPLDVANFGAPTDIDQNGHVVILFTRAVNELTERSSEAFVGGFFFARDLFPRVATSGLEGCPGSNVAEMFYLLAPDPSGTINGNVRTRGFVDSLTTGVIGHEFQHLINAARRVYVNSASDFEVVWLNEGLSHIAEELLFYREGSLAPRQNLGVAAIRGSAAARNAFNQDQAANAGRYRDYLQAPANNSPIRDDDSLATRGATWNLLRYAADRKLRAGGQESAVWLALVNSTTTGVANLRAVVGPDVGGLIRDWSVSHYTDDVVGNVVADYTQPSWNWHDLYPALGGGGGSYPLLVTPLSGSGASGVVVPGGSVFYRFAVPANTLAPIVLSGGSAAAGLAQGTIVRIR
jgi:hypothetical protein